MKIIIAGSRTITNYHYVKTVMKQSGWLDDITVIVSGCAAGVDTIALKYAENFDITTAEFPADWKKYGKGAGYHRNVEMAQYADRLIAIQQNFSKGTDHMVQTMLNLKKPVFLTQYMWL